MIIGFTDTMRPILDEKEVVGEAKKAIEVARDEITRIIKEIAEQFKVLGHEALIPELEAQGKKGGLLPMPTFCGISLWGEVPEGEDPLNSKDSLRWMYVAGQKDRYTHIVRVITEARGFIASLPNCTTKKQRQMYLRFIVEETVRVKYYTKYEANPPGWDEGLREYPSAPKTL